jgi:hypothetical protein
MLIPSIAVWEIGNRVEEEVNTSSKHIATNAHGHVNRARTPNIDGQREYPVVIPRQHSHPKP